MPRRKAKLSLNKQQRARAIERKLTNKKNRWAPNLSLRDNEGDNDVQGAAAQQKPPNISKRYAKEKNVWDDPWTDPILGGKKKGLKTTWLDPYKYLDEEHSSPEKMRKAYEQDRDISMGKGKKLSEKATTGVYEGKVPRSAAGASKFWESKSPSQRAMGVEHIIYRDGKAYRGFGSNPSTYSRMSKSQLAARKRDVDLEDRGLNGDGSSPKQAFRDFAKQSQQREGKRKAARMRGRGRRK